MNVNGEIQNSTGTFFLLLLLPLLLTSAKVIYVLPTEVDSEDYSLRVEHPPVKNAYNLSELVTLEHMYGGYFKSGTTIVLFSGTHVVGNEIQHESLSITKVHNLNIQGRYFSSWSLTSTAKIKCIGQFGLRFFFVSNLKIQNVEFENCAAFTSACEYYFDPTSYYYGCSAYKVMCTIYLNFGTDVTFDHVSIINSTGIGLFMQNMYGHVTVSNSLVIRNVVSIYILNDAATDTRYLRHALHSMHHVHIAIQNTSINFNPKNHENLKASSKVVQRSAGLVIESTCLSELKTMGINLNFNKFEGNFRDILLQFHSISLSSKLKVNVSIFNLVHFANPSMSTSLILDLNGEGPITVILDIFDSSLSRGCFRFQGAGFSYSTRIKLKNIRLEGCLCYHHACVSLSSLRAILENVSIISHSSGEKLFGGDLAQKPVIVEAQKSIISIEGTFLYVGNKGGIVTEDCRITFSENSISVIANNTLDSDTTPFFMTTWYMITSHINFDPNSSVIFENNIGTLSGAISLHSASSLYFSKASTGKFINNTGINGGAMALYDLSGLYIVSEQYTQPQIEFIENKAGYNGGAIYVEEDGYVNTSTNTLHDIFLSVSRDRGIYNEDTSAVIAFINNVAGNAGSALYGGWLSGIASSDHGWKDLESFDLLYHVLKFIGNESDPSQISSNPTRVCMCVNNAIACNKTDHTVDIYPGQSFQINAVTVGQQFGTVPSVVRTEFSPESGGKINRNEYVQIVDKYCTKLEYKVQTRNPSETLVLTVDLKYRSRLNMDVIGNIVQLKPEQLLLFEKFFINVQLKKCSQGFQFDKDSSSCVCQKALTQRGIKCNTHNFQEIFRISPKWINTTFSHTSSTNKSTLHGVLVHDHCPFDYCVYKPKNISLDLTSPDKQCAFNRTGILCGACQTNLSQVLGTSKCKQCSNSWLLPHIAVFLVAGIALVVTLMLLNLTVAVGTINSLIFYANIVRANHVIFFPPETANSLLSWFVAWLNLDIGVEVCLFNGLDAYAKAWLQFLFPLYVWFLVIAVIVSCRYSITAVKLCGNNAIKALATLFLLSYAKMLRVIIIIFQLTTIVYPDGYQRRVWLYDGNVDYLKGKHIPLFITALLFLIFLSIPYTTVLLTVQWLHKFSHYHVLLSWVHKLMPIFDAYCGPYKDKHRYWTGALLLVRVLLFLTFSLNVFGDPSINLLAITITSVCLLAYLSLTGGIYKLWTLNIIEILFLLNIGILSATTLYIINKGGNTDPKIITFISTSIAFITFVAIFSYHVFQRIVTDRIFRRFKYKLTLRRALREGRDDLGYHNMMLLETENPQPVSETEIDVHSIMLNASLETDDSVTSQSNTSSTN